MPPLPNALHDVLAVTTGAFAGCAVFFGLYITGVATFMRETAERDVVTRAGVGLLMLGLILLFYGA